MDVSSTLLLNNCGTITKIVIVPKYLWLAIIRVNNNLLTELPSEIGSLYCLKYLYLSNNDLVVLPEEIGNLYLTNIVVDRDLLYPPIAAIVYTTRRIMEYLRTHPDTISSRGRYKNMLNVINLIHIVDTGSMFDRLPIELLVLIKEFVLSDPYTPVI